MNNFLHFIGFINFCVWIVMSYFILDFGLWKLTTGYRSIYPNHKTFYVRSNMIKGLLLGFWSPYAISLLYNMYVYNSWNKGQLKILAALYSSLDTVSLYMVPKMQLNTIVHHVAVFLLYMYCLWCDFELVGLTRIIIVYAIWSTLAWSVNLYLSLRVFVHRNNYRLHILCIFAFFSYLGCCIMNWSYQLNSLYNFWNDGEFGIGCSIYSITMLFIIYDDIVLMHYLRKRITNYKQIKN